MTGEDVISVGQLRRWAERWDEQEDDPLVFVVVGMETSGGMEYATVLTSEGHQQVHRLGHILAFSESF